MNTTQSKTNNLTRIILILLLIIALGSFVRIYKLGETPAGLSWDEAAVGYNAWSIANFGRDEWGQTLPLVFKSFLDDKHPVHIYMTVVTVKLFGLSEFSTRLSSALFGIFNILLIYLLTKKMFKSNLVGIIAAFLLAISPYSIHYSRFNHEFNFALFFYMLGLWLFFKSVQDNPKWLPLAVFCFGIDFITYHSPKIIVPLTVIFLGVLFWKKIVVLKKQLIMSGIVLLFFGLIVFLNPALLGAARAKQAGISKEQIVKTDLYAKTGNEFLGHAEIFVNQYISHFSYNYLFRIGDQNPRLGPHDFGEFYMLDLVFLIIGLLALVKRRSKEAVFLIFLCLISPIPASLTNEAPHSARAMFMAISLEMVIAFGIYQVVQLLKNKNAKLIFGVLVVVGYIFLFNGYFGNYLKTYDKKNANEFQYGMKEIVQYADKHPEYQKIYMTDVRSQPYIFFLYYLKIPPDELLKTVKYNTGATKSYNLISSFGRFQFGGWDVIESDPGENAMYVVEDSKYGGLKYKDRFGIDKIIKFPDGGTAFYLVAGS